MVKIIMESQDNVTIKTQVELVNVGANDVGGILATSISDLFKNIAEEKGERIAAKVEKSFINALAVNKICKELGI